MFRADGDPRQALAERLLSARTPALRLGLFDDPSVPGGDQPELARDYAALGATDSAVVVYERYLAVRSLSRVGTDAFELGGALERESALLEARGDVSRAADRARRLATLWSGADERFRIRAQQALRRAERLGASLPPIREVRGRPTR
jgi:hypothetical protein